MNGSICGGEYSSREEIAVTLGGHDEELYLRLGRGTLTVAQPEFTP